MTDLYRPLRSLREGHWFKLICGASFQHLPAIRNLSLAYTLAGADCIDVAADPAVINAARDGIEAAVRLSAEARHRGYSMDGLPLLMVSLNDGDDPHFRKAEFDPDRCPSDCPRPCEQVCPANAIVFNRTNDNFSGVIDQLCYGCGRCLPLCPIQQIQARSYVFTPAAIAPLVLETVEAVEIHTQVGRYEDFKRLWSAIVPFVDRLKLVAVSCPDGEGLIEYLRTLYDLLSPLPCPVVWQTDGRPMSGDIGDGATRAAVKLGQKVLEANLPGYVQLAGGTNRYTVSKLRTLGLLNSSLFNSLTLNTLQLDSVLNSSQRQTEMPLPSNSRYIAGIAFGSYARTLLAPLLEQIEQAPSYEFSVAPPPVDRDSATAVRAATAASSHLAIAGSPRLEVQPSLLWEAVQLADSLVSTLKTPMKPQI